MMAAEFFGSNVSATRTESASSCRDARCKNFNALAERLKIEYFLQFGAKKIHDARSNYRAVFVMKVFL